MRQGSMKFPTCAALVLLAVSVLILACKEEDSLAFSTKVDEENLCHEVAEVMCSNVFECCRGKEIEEVFGVKLTTSEGECRTDMELACSEQTAALRHSLAQGRTALRAGRVDACLKAYVVGEAGCFPEVTKFVPQCDAELIRGNQASGAKCLFSFECTGEAYCGPDRKCQPLPKEGEHCNAEIPCAEGFYCDYFSESVSLCQPRQGVGDGCASPDIPDACEEGAVCRLNPDYGADPEAEPYVCTEKRPIGEACDSDDICLSGECLPGTCEGEGVCFTDADCVGSCRDAPDVECSDDGDCWGICQSSGAACNDASVCAEGDRCVQEDECEGAAVCGGASCAQSYFVANYCTRSLIDSFAVGMSTETTAGQ